MTTENDLLRQISGLKQLIASDQEAVRIAHAYINSNKKVLSNLKDQLIEIRDKALYGNGISFKDSLIDVYDPDFKNTIYPSIFEHRKRYYQEFEDRINGIKPRIGKVYVKRSVQIVPQAYSLAAKITNPGKVVLDTFYRLTLFKISHNCSNIRMRRLSDILNTEIIDNLPKIDKLEIRLRCTKTATYSLSNHTNCSCISINGDSYFTHKQLLFVFEGDGIYIYSNVACNTDSWELFDICNKEELYTKLLYLRQKGYFNFPEIKEYK